jgi:hypothetical protein
MNLRPFVVLFKHENVCENVNVTSDIMVQAENHLDAIDKARLKLSVTLVDLDDKWVLTDIVCKEFNNEYSNEI